MARLSIRYGVLQLCFSRAVAVLEGRDAPRNPQYPRNAPDGASECSHGCSGAAAKPPAAEPVESSNFGFAPDGATESET